jgi:transposase
VAEVSTIGLDIAKHVFQAHGADASGRVVFRKKIARLKLIEFFASQPRCVVALEACGGAITGGARSANWATRCG